MNQLVFVCRGDFKQSVDDMVGRDAVALGGEINDEAMAEHRFGKCGDIFERDVRPAVHQGPGFGAENEELSGTWTGAPGQLISSEIGRARFTYARLANECERVTNQVVADRDGADQFLELANLFGREDGLDLFGPVACGAAGDLELVVEVGICHQHLEHEAILLRFG
jgi:hypothetical protein